VGDVRAIVGDKVDVPFPSGEVRRFSLEFVRLVSKAHDASTEEAGAQRSGGANLG
jgi:hypothetical protein